MRRGPRYRLRTWLREHAPEPLSRLFPPGSRDCGEHEWFPADDATDRCWHCLVGVRPHRPVPIDPDSGVWQGLREAARSGDSGSQRIVLRMMAEHEAYEAVIAADMRETAGRLDLDPSAFDRQASNAAETSEWLTEAAERVARS